MDKFSRILVVIFTLLIVNLGLSIYTITKLPKESNNKNDIKQLESITAKVSLSPSPSTKPIPTPNTDIKSDLNTIKAEIRSLKESLSSSGLIIETTKTNNNE